MNLSPLPKQAFLDSNGRPLVGGLLFTYAAGTSTKQTTYIDQAGSQPNTNPIVLDYRGEANVWLDITKVYKFVLSPRGDTDPPTKPIWSVDKIAAPVSLVDITQQIIGGILYPQTPAEAAAGVVPTNYYLPPGWVGRYGAVGNNVADDTAALARAVSCNRELRFHVNGSASSTTYTTTAELLFDSATPLHIYFDANVYLKTTGATNRAIHITGQPSGTTSAKAMLQSVNIIGANSGTADSAIFLDGVALAWLHDTVIVGSTFTAGILGQGFQQGEISGGYIAQMAYGIHLYRDAVADIGSNGIEIHAVSLNTTNTEILIEDSDSIMVHHNHMIGAPIGIDINSNTNSCFADLIGNHIEGPSGGPFTAAIQLRGTNTRGILVQANKLQGSGKCLWVKNGSAITIDANTFSAGDVTIDSGVSHITISNNYAVAGSATTYSNAATLVTQFNNTSDGSAFSWAETLSPAQITSNTNDYAPTTYGPYTKVLRLSTDASRQLTGLTGGWDLRQLVIFNVGANDLVLVDSSGSSSAANRFALGANKTITPSQGITLQYESAGQLWRSAGRLA